MGLNYILTEIAVLDAGINVSRSSTMKVLPYLSNGRLTEDHNTRRDVLTQCWMTTLNGGIFILN